jgi:hypothetical protein
VLKCNPNVVAHLSLIMAEIHCCAFPFSNNIKEKTKEIRTNEARMFISCISAIASSTCRTRNNYLIRVTALELELP